MPETPQSPRRAEQIRLWITTLTPPIVALVNFATALLNR
jgi:hypothetical protein